MRELSWSHNLLILGRDKREKEREFYLRLACVQKWSSRELERQITVPCSSEWSCRRQNCQHRGQNCTRGAVEVFTCMKPPAK